MWMLPAREYDKTSPPLLSRYEESGGPQLETKLSADDPTQLLRTALYLPVVAQDANSAIAAHTKKNLFILAPLLPFAPNA
jgi:hypothetical protein